jgi:hypothetical protein
MALTMMPTNIQKMEFDVTTAEGPCRVTLVTGSISVILQAASNTGAIDNRAESLRALVDPKLTPGQFRKATATAAIAVMGENRTIGGGAPNAVARWTINEVEASLDDESGQIEIRIDVVVTAQNTAASLEKLNFQVTTLAKIP